MAATTLRGRAGSGSYAATSSRYDRIARALRADPTLSGRELAETYNLTGKTGKPNTRLANRIKAEIVAKRGRGDLVGPASVRPRQRVPRTRLRAKGPAPRSLVEYPTTGQVSSGSYIYQVNIVLGCKTEHPDGPSQPDAVGYTHYMSTNQALEFAGIPGWAEFDQVVSEKVREYMDEAREEAVGSPPEAHDVDYLGYRVFTVNAQGRVVYSGVDDPGNRRKAAEHPELSQYWRGLRPARAIPVEYPIE